MRGRQAAVNLTGTWIKVGTANSQLSLHAARLLYPDGWMASRKTGCLQMHLLHTVWILPDNCCQTASAFGLPNRQ